MIVGREEIELILAPEAPARRVLSLCRLYAGMRAIGVTLQEALLQKPPVIWCKDQFAVDPDHWRPAMSDFSLFTDLPVKI
jgi:hypothetical protein